MAEKGKAESIAALFIYNDDDEMDEEEEKLEHRDAGTAERDTFPSVTAGVEEQYGDKGRNGDAGVLGMFNYGQDEAAASPEREEDDRELDLGLLSAEGPESDQGMAREKPRTPPGTVFILPSKSNGGTPIPSPLADDRVGDQAVHQAGEERRGDKEGREEAAINASGEGNRSANEKEEASPMETEDSDKPRGVLDSFLPPPPTDTCSAELQAKFARYLHIKRVQGRNINDAIRMTKGYKNPDFMQQAVEHQGIDEIGSCFPKEIYDPRGVAETDYFDSIALEQRRLNERREQERKQKGQIEFQRGGVQLPSGPPKPVVQLISGQRGIFTSMPMNMGVNVTGLPQMLGTAVAVGAAAATIIESDGKKEVRDRKRSKWDRVEGDHVRGPAGKSAQEALAAAKAHAAMIGSGNIVLPASRPPTAQTKVKEADGDGKARDRVKREESRTQKLSTLKTTVL